MANGYSFYPCLVLAAASLITGCGGQCHGTVEYLWATAEWKTSLSIYDGFHPHRNLLRGSICRHHDQHFYSSGEYMLIAVSSADLRTGASFTISYRATDPYGTTTVRYVTTSTTSTPDQGEQGSFSTTGIFALICISMAAILLGVGCVLCRRRRRRRHLGSSADTFDPAPIPRLMPRPSIQPRPHHNHTDTRGLFTLSEGVLAYDGNTNSFNYAYRTSAHGGGNINAGFSSAGESPPSYGEVVSNDHRRTQPRGGATCEQAGAVSLPSYEETMASDSSSTRREGGAPCEQATKESLPSYDEAVTMLDITAASRTDSGHPSEN